MIHITAEKERERKKQNSQRAVENYGRKKKPKSKQKWRVEKVHISAEPTKLKIRNQ